MTKIMIVEDDKSLREIYGVRLLAEGYDIVSAGDGEEALAMTIKERPHLIITDLMMPRIGGFDFIDILRSTTETRNIKVIVMTALGSDDHRQRGEAMGADRYLVKSQVGIEDVVRVVHEVLGDASTPQSAPSVSAATSPTPQVQPPVPPQPMRPTPPASATTAPQPAVMPPQRPPMPQSSFTTPSPPSARQRVIQPINDPTSKININELLDRELAREAGVNLNNPPQVATTAQEKAEVANQLRAIEDNPPQPSVPPVAIDSQGHLDRAGQSQASPQPPAAPSQTTAQPVPQPPTPIDRGQVQAPPARPTTPQPTAPPRPAANNPNPAQTLPQTPSQGNTPNPAV